MSFTVIKEDMETPNQLVRSVKIIQKYVEIHRLSWWK